MAELDLLTSVSDVSTQPPVIQGGIPHFLRKSKPAMTAMPQQTPAEKAEGAYKTISEVAEELDVPTHVLRFWESRFPQVKPQRMRGGRRYYRLADVDVLKKIKTLLYSQGYTIKGARKHVKDKSHEIHQEMPPVMRQEPALPVATPVVNAKLVAPATAPKVEAVAMKPAEPAKPEVAAEQPKKQLPAEITALLRELRDLKKTLATFN